MVRKLGNGAGKAAKSSPALRVSTLRKLLARITERVEALRGEEPDIAEEEKSLKLLAQAVKLEGELRALRPNRAKTETKLNGQERQAHDEAMRQNIAERLARLGRAKPRKLSGKPRKPGTSAAAR
jgi:hypothetical protein